MSTKIHPSAIVERGAELDESVTVGPFAYIGPDVKVKSNTVIHHHATIERSTTIGSECQIYPYSLIGGMTQDTKYKGEKTGVIIGDRNIFREYVTVHIGTKEGNYTTLGNDNLLLAYSHVAHDCQVGNHLTMSSLAALAGHVIVNDHANIGWNTGVHQFCRVGAYAMLGGCSKVVQDVPPYMMVDGNPAEVKTINKLGLQRAGFSEADLKTIYTVHKILYRGGLNRSQAVKEIRSHEGLNTAIAEKILNFILQSKRGIV